MTDQIPPPLAQPDTGADDVERWPLERPVEIPLPAEEIEANAVALQAAMFGRRILPTTPTIADYPEVTRHYLPELNGGIPASGIPRFLEIDVVWYCDAIPGEIHRWRAMPQNFTRTVLKGVARQREDSLTELRSKQVRQRGANRYSELLAAGLTPTWGCPCCSGRMATEGNNLKQSHPEVVDHWDFTRNIYGPELYLPRSEHSVYWCDPTSRRSTRASIVSRTQLGKVGTNRQDCGLEASETNNLGLLHPQVASRLVSAEDGSEVDPFKVSPRSRRTMIWTCSHPRHPDFAATVDSMVAADLNGTGPKGCPACRGFVLAPGCSLADLYPDVAADYERAATNGIPASQVIPGTAEYADFTCGECSYSWRARVAWRTRGGQGCPACRGTAVTPENNLAVRYPELVEEWHPDNTFRPTEVRPASTRDVKWVCRKDPTHVWTAKPASRTRRDIGTGCPHCDTSGVSKEQVRFFLALAECLPGLLYETEDCVPDECRLEGSRFVFDAVWPEHRIAFEYDGHRWHSEPKHRERDQRKNAKAEAAGFTVIRIRIGLDPISPNDVRVDGRLDVESWLEQVVRKAWSLIERRKQAK